MHLLFDYFGVHERGITLLREVRTAVHDDLVTCFGELYLIEEALLPQIVVHIFDIVARIAKAAEQSKISDYNVDTLNKASGVVKAFLEQEGAISRGLMGARELMRAVQYARENGRGMESVQIWDPQRAQDENEDGL